MQKKSLIIGAAMLDIIVNIDRLPNSGEDVYASSQSMNVGGCAYNVADILKHFQAPHTLFVPIGTGMYAEFIENSLKREGHISPIKSSDMDNGYCMCMVEKGGERTFLTLPGIECSFQKEWFQMIHVSEYESVYVSGYELEGEGGGAILEFLEKNPELLVYYAPGPRITHISQEKTKRLHALSPILHLNEMESISYTKEEGVEKAAEKLFQLTGNTVIITRGADGVYLLEKGKAHVIPAEKTKVTDTIGAGDSHIGAVMAMRGMGHSFETSVAAANKVSAMVVGVKGPTLTSEEFKKGNWGHGKA